MIIYQLFFKTWKIQIMLARLTGETQYKTAVKAFCDSKVNQPKTPKGLLFVNKWGSLRHASNVAFICLQVMLVLSQLLTTVSCYN